MGIKKVIFMEHFTDLFTGLEKAVPALLTIAGIMFFILFIYGVEKLGDKLSGA